MQEENFIVNGKGVLSYDNIKSVCEHGNKEDLTKVLNVVGYSIEQTQEEIDLIELGFTLINVDLINLDTNLKALKKVNATKEQIKEVIGVKLEEVTNYQGKVSYLGYLTNMKNKIEEAMG